MATHVRPGLGVSFAGIKQAMRQLPITAAQDIAALGAPELTRKTQEAFASNKNVYGDSRGWHRPGSEAEGREGEPLTLVKSAATVRSLKFVAVGTIMRAVLGTRYAKYLIGKYKVLPCGNAAIPIEWRKTLNDIAHGVLSRVVVRLGGASATSEPVRRAA